MFKEMFGAFSLLDLASARNFNASHDIESISGALCAEIWPSQDFGQR
jgi:hypothetical protein